ncbi:MAG TPA: protein kinase [Bryobacterales bacterium]|nr:protein kinase [Bryobacterales bacterium]
MAGERLSHYRIVEKVGAGGMGVVYRARDEQLDRDVALKVLPAATLEDETARARFRQEARALSRLNHPNICTIYEVGEAEGETYIAMEFVEGRPLSEVARAGALPLERTLRYGAQIADALAHAHERDIVHRDLKSANVMVTPEGRAKVLDFGLAKRAAPREAEATRTQGLTEAGTVVGTLHYMAPEVLRGATADARSDIWALGVILHEMASGELPFAGQTGFEVSSAILREPPKPLPAQAAPGLRAIIQKCLAKEPGERYQRAGEVRAALEATQSSAVSMPVVAAPAAAATSRRWIWAAAAVVVMAAAITGWMLRGRSGAKPAAGGRIESLAVLPLENLSHDPQQDYFADGMTEQLITDLSKISSLRVISRTSVMGYKGAHKPLPAIAQELNVDGIVEGSVLRSGDRVRITAQLIQAKADRHLWAESYERDLRDVLALQNEVARTIAGAIQAKVTPQEQARLAGGRRVDPEVQELYLKGRFYGNKFSEESLLKAISLFEQAAQKDPQYALAQAGMADAWASLSSTYRAPREVMPNAKAAALEALRLDETLSEAHTSLGYVQLMFDWDWGAAARELQRAIELNPSSSEAHGAYSWYLLAMERREEAVREGKRAVELDPLSMGAYSTLEWTLDMSGRYDEAVAVGRKAVELDPSFAMAYAQMSVALAQAGRRGEAVAPAEKATQIDDSPMLKAYLAQAYGAAGQRREAEKTLGELAKIAARRYVCSYEVAEGYLGLGRTEEAFRWFEKAYTDRSDCMIFLKVDPRLDRLRGDARYRDLLRRVGFTL